MKKIGKVIFITVFWFAVWQIASVAVGTAVLLPSPLETAKALCDLLKTSSFYLAVLSTLFRIVAGYVAGAVVGLLCGGITYLSPFINSLLSPLASTVKATPVASFIVLLFVWFSNGSVSSVTAFLMVLPVIWNSFFTALNNTDKKLLEMAALFKIKKATVIKEIYIPSVLPVLKGGFATAMGLAWKAGVAAEVICNPKNSIGGGIYNAKVYLETPDLFAWTFTVIVVSLILEKAVIHHLFKGGEK